MSKIYPQKNGLEISQQRTKETTFSQIRVVVVERENLYRKVIKKVLEEESDLSVVGDFENIADAQSTICHLGPNVVITDRLSDEDSYYENAVPCCSIISDCSDANILLLTSETDIEKLRNADLSLIMGYLLKSAEIEELIKGVREVAAAHPFVCKEMRQVIVRAIGSARTTKSPASSVVKKKNLSPRELEVLHLLASGLSRKEIANRLFISVKTVSTHRENILLKLDLKSNSDLVKYALLNDTLDQENYSPLYSSKKSNCL